MALSAVEKEKLWEECQARARRSFEAVFGEDQQEQLRTLTQREDRILQVTEELQTWLLAEHLKRDPQAKPAPGAGIRCPVCRGAAQRIEGEAGWVPRELQTRTGRQEFGRQAYRCPSCRRSFFPLG
jgi:uncharacterized protein with PIN domain